MKKIMLLVILFGILNACMPVEIQVVKQDGKQLTIAFYPGGNSLDDLIIINWVNYFGKAMYQFDDPLGDIGFRFNDGKKVRSECISEGNDILGQVECKMYEVYRSNFDLIPEGTKVPRPQLF